MVTHSPIGLVSLIISIVGYAFTLQLYFTGVNSKNSEILIAISLGLAIIALITGLIARLMKKDNFGIPGILTIIVIPLFILASL